MIKSIKLENYRNLKMKYVFSNNFYIFFGPNNSGKSNLLDGIKLAFSEITGDYVKVKKSDFNESDDSKPIIIEVELEYDSIPTLNFAPDKCGFKLVISKTQSGRYARKLTLLNGSNVDYEILREDSKIPKISTIPLIRTEDLYNDGLLTGISKFIDEEEKYKGIKEQSKKALRESMSSKILKFKEFCKKFNQELDIDFTEPRLIDEKAFVVDGTKEHNFIIGAGYKSIANIILNTLDESSNIILIDEIENHLHPSLIRTLVREVRELKNVFIIATTHSPVVINESKIDELYDIKGNMISSLDGETKRKLNMFLHPGRAEILFAENVVLVEGYTEELLLKDYLRKKNHNWTVVNVAGVMFEPYIKMAYSLKKKVVVISDTDIVTTNGKDKSERFKNLENLCATYNMKILSTFNTLESDLYKSGLMDNAKDFVEPHSTYKEIYVAKNKCKTEIAFKLIENNVDLSEWHIIKELENEFRSH